MRFALPVAAVAAVLSAVVLASAAHAKDCAADPKGAIKVAEAEFKKAKKGMDKAQQKGFMKSLDKAKMAAKTKQNDVACDSLAQAMGFMAAKK